MAKVFDLEGSINTAKADAATAKKAAEEAKTKSFKVLIKDRNADMNGEKFRDPKLWVKGVFVSQYRRPRNRNTGNVDKDARQPAQT